MISLFKAVHSRGRPLPWMLERRRRSLGVSAKSFRLSDGRCVYVALAVLILLLLLLLHLRGMAYFSILAALDKFITFYVLLSEQ